MSREFPPLHIYYLPYNIKARACPRSISHILLANLPPLTLAFVRSWLLKRGQSWSLNSLTRTSASNKIQIMRCQCNTDSTSVVLPAWLVLQVISCDYHPKLTGTVNQQIMLNLIAAMSWSWFGPISNNSTTFLTVTVN